MTILNEFDYTPLPISTYIFILLIIALLSFFITFSFIVFSKKGKDIDLFINIITSGATALILVTIVGLLLGSTQLHTCKRYQVVIDNEQSFNDVYSKYNIISLDGKIYTLEDKDSSIK